ncbi:AAA family ATPase [Streptomyces sp. NPDC001843]|uniref:AAA family ATPase n=1 Tax=Streptomyces sp. NPDC001843 TaxID=3364617 RepID=UPI003683FB8B
MRVELVMAAKRHGMPTVAVVVATRLSVCLERQSPRPDNRRVPEDVVRAQHQAMVHSHQRLAAEGFSTTVFVDTLYRLEPFLERLSQAREAELGRDGSTGFGGPRRRTSSPTRPTSPGLTGGGSPAPTANRPGSRAATSGPGSPASPCRTRSATPVPRG